MPAVCVKGHLDAPHCSPMVRFGASTNVFVNGIGISRQTDHNTSHLIPFGEDCIFHTAPITTGSLTVRVNGLGCGRIGDSLTACTSVAAGSINVFAGG